MKFKLNISPGMIIFILGFSGLVFVLAESPGQIGGKIPLALFFLFVITVGIIVESKLKNKDDEIFGEVEGGGFG